VANLVDEIAYYSHDLDDGLDSGLLSEQELRRDDDPGLRRQVSPQGARPFAG
jgi:hypothetical protein